MHTVFVILGVIANIISALAIIAIIAGLVWIMFPPKDKHYLGAVDMVDIYVYYNPLGGRLTGLCILGVGITSLILGLLLDRVHSKLMARFGART